MIPKVHVGGCLPNGLSEEYLPENLLRYNKSLHTLLRKVVPSQGKSCQLVLHGHPLPDHCQTKVVEVRTIAYEPIESGENGIRANVVYSSRTSPRVG